VQIKFSTNDIVAMKPITLLHVVSYDSIEITASEITADFSLELRTIVPWKHSLRCIVSLHARRGTTNRYKV